MSDNLIGGSSKSHFDFLTASSEISTSTPSSTSPSSTSPPTLSTPSSYARFHGHISTALPPDRPDIKRTGYAAFRTPEQRGTAFGRSVWDIDPYSYLALRIKSDGRAYFVNLQSETVEPTDLHQHRLFAKRPGQWETVLIRWNDFVRTNYGFVVEPQTELLRQKVKTVGIGLTDRVEGPFELCIERIWATNDVQEGTVVKAAQGGIGGGAAEATTEGSSLKNKKGVKISW